MPKLHDFLVSGRTSVSVDGTATGVIATKAVEFHDDGTVRFTSVAGRQIRINSTSNLNELWKIIFTGTGGVAAGKKFFSV